MMLARGGSPGKPVVYYEYHPMLALEHAKNLFPGFEGDLQIDGCEGDQTAVEGNPEISLVCCFAHV